MSIRTFGDAIHQQTHNQSDDPVETLPAGDVLFGSRMNYELIQSVKKNSDPNSSIHSLIWYERLCTCRIVYYQGTGIKLR